MLVPHLKKNTFGSASLMFVRFIYVMKIENKQFTINPGILDFDLVSFVGPFFKML